jgi:hypothetical protein
MSTVEREDMFGGSRGTPIMHESQTISMKQAVENKKEFNVEASLDFVYLVKT